MQGRTKYSQWYLIYYPFALPCGTATCPYDVLLFTAEDADWVPPSMSQLRGLARLIIGEDNDAVLKILIKGRSQTFRHVPRAQRVDVDFIHELMKDKSVSALYIIAKVQIADMFIKGGFTIP